MCSSLEGVTEEEPYVLDGKEPAQEWDGVVSRY